MSTAKKRIPTNLEAQIELGRENTSRNFKNSQPYQ